MSKMNEILACAVIGYPRGHESLILHVLDSQMYPATMRRGGLMVSALDSGASAPGSSPGRGHCVVFLGKTLHSHSASLHPGV